MVYEAVHAESGRRAALKVPRADVVAREQAEAALRVEGALLRRIVHPNVVELLDAGDDERGAPYLALELSEGEDLAERLAREPTLPFELVLEIGAQLLSAIGAIAALGVVHRDIKPENVMVEATPGAVRVRLIDLGIATKVRGLWPERGGELAPFIGTPEYVSPEQAQGLPVDVRSDLYSLGALLYELVTGRVPSSGAGQYETLVRVMTADPAPPRTLRPDCPPLLERVIMRSLAKERAARYQSPEAMARALASCAPREPARRQELDETEALPLLRPRRGARRAPSPARGRRAQARSAPHVERRANLQPRVDIERWLWPIALVLLVFSLLGAVLGGAQRGSLLP